MAAASGPFPSLSQLLSWPTEHLTRAADYWVTTGNRWYEVFSQNWRDSLSVDWKGNGAEALRTRTYADHKAVGDLVDQLHEAAKVARGAASDLYAARSRVRYAVEDARDAGFDIGENLSVTDRSAGGSSAVRAARQAQAQAFAADIRQRAMQLVGLDQQIAARVTTAMAGVGSIFPADNPTTTTTTTPPPPPKCDPEDIAKLMRKIDEWNKRDAELTDEINAYNREKHDFNINDPEERRKAEDYIRRGQELQAKKDKLLYDQRILIRQVTECGAKIVDGHIQWPDGSTSPTPTPTPTPGPTR
ncbi:hypothetical protein LAUMK42_03063 [Mycobacterium persicum]|uniref:Transmembrane protein n=1 Tax=Mycobacterium persicum TaxID=1487726 RepID=A0AB38UU40_9MYCO|nr:hypothetical protein [Mycobacterium persicum]ORB88253.1 hypothetical protein B1T49_01935 [Mycobacterium persicum]ORB88881.1 hypothetical protein B1T49_06035 [Mycobacterium persicum]VAZ84244.1 hypothetical protein LAUMK42_03063 [Mycobacterium persicum]